MMRPSRQSTASPRLRFPMAAPVVVCEGWLLKKRRKKMQGFARRYFVLFNTGALQYSFGPGQPIRDQIFLHHAAVSTSSGRKDIHIDSNEAIFHIKCLSTDDFNMWMTTFRKFINSGAEVRRSNSIRQTSRQGSMQLNRSENIVEGMATTIEKLEESISSLVQSLATRKPSNVHRKEDKAKHKEKDKHKDHAKETVFSLFKKPNFHVTGDLGTEDQEEVTPVVQGILALLEQLKNQHAILTKSMQTRSATDVRSGYYSPLPPTHEEYVRGSPELEAQNKVHAATFAPRRYSTATTVSDGTHEWFDAIDDIHDGPEEFFMDRNVSPERNSHILPSDSQSSLENIDRSSNDTDIEEDSQTHQPLSSGQSRNSSLVVRRTQLPAPVTGDEGSLFSILKNNVGKDLSTITLPVSFNEPLTLLQRAAEEVEYFNLLNEAARSDNPIERLSYVAAFAVSGYAHTRHRSGRKGFNPMLSETFEDSRMKFIAEKVRHHPVEMAYHAEGDNWELTATSSGRTKFWGKSLEIIPQGITRLRIGNDHFVWTKPSSFMRNLMVGTKYLEHCGNLTVNNTTNNYRCDLEFKQSGYWGPSNVVSGPIYSPDGKLVSRLEGNWDDHISQTFDSSNFRLLWRINPFPKDSQEYYGFTSFGITLNEITPDLFGELPATDSRYRPDVRALEHGDLDTAEAEKTRVETMQRERRQNGQDRQPRWFKFVGGEWTYAGGYWEARAHGWQNESIAPLW